MRGDQRCCRQEVGTRKRFAALQGQPRREWAGALLARNVPVGWGGRGSGSCPVVACLSEDLSGTGAVHVLVLVLTIRSAQSLSAVADNIDQQPLLWICCWAAVCCALLSGGSLLSGRGNTCANCSCLACQSLVCGASRQPDILGGWLLPAHAARAVAPRHGCWYTIASSVPL